MKQRLEDKIIGRPGRVTTSHTNVSINALKVLSTLTGVKGKVEDVNGTAHGILVLESPEGTLHCTVDQFGDAYRGMVRMWPQVAIVRDTQDKRRQVQAAEARQNARIAKAAADKAAKEKARREREAIAKAAKAKAAKAVKPKAK